MFVKQPPQSVFCIFGLTEGQAAEFRREVAENGALLGHYAASSGNLLSTLKAILWGLNLNRQVVQKRR